ncbi:hypothetical protein Leryth_006287 [Lithospermum erythrorhizon]|nr:hypothetical protein Leryth_006287 [Lithospermum erythrorhizon]
MYSSSSSDVGFKELQLEANVLMSVHHRNLTSLIGYCIDGPRVGIIYEYMANGDLRKHLSAISSRVLSWQERMRIAVDVAQGLEYMHHGCKPPIVHRDVKSSNILLDQNFKAKIADFGLCKPFPNETVTHVSTKRVAGTKGYLDPAYEHSGRLTQRSDVYSFGIVLLEIITSKPATNLTQWVSFTLEQGDALDVVDPRLIGMGEFDVPSATKAIQIATTCASQDPTERPTMNNVVVELRQCLLMEMTRQEMILPKKSVHDSVETEVSLMSTEILYVGR